MAEHNLLGKEGENIAIEFLRHKNYTIIETNWRFSKAELDIIAKYDNKLIVIEVKTRSSDFFEQPFDSVNRKKQKNIIEAANAYVIKKNIDLEVRFDIISIIFSKGKHKIEHIEDAFYPLIK